MLRPNNQKLLVELLGPPDGFVLERAVCTTYTLDFDTLMLSVLALGGFEASVEEGRELEPQTLLTGLDSADKLSVFVDAGELEFPETSRNEAFERLIEQVLVPVSPPAKTEEEYYSFHPKVWLLHFTPNLENSASVRGDRAYGDNADRFRLICTSRNLSKSRSMELALRLDGERASDRESDRSQHAVSQLLDYLLDQVG